MRFLAGLLLGLLLSGPPQERTFEVTEAYDIRVDVRQVPPPPEPLSEPLPDSTWQEVDGQEACLIDILGGPTAPWTAEDVLAALDAAWRFFDGPCAMLEAVS